MHGRDFTARGSGVSDSRAMLPGYADQPEHFVLGLMSGTSADGIDAALVRITGATAQPRAELVAFHCFAYPDELRRLLVALDPATPHGVVCELNFALGERFAEAALDLLRSSGVSPNAVQLIGSHGQTVCHLPAAGATTQIAEPAVIAQRTGLPVVADFRVADLAAGGEGAPLTPMADFILVRHPTRHRIVQNIGGIANLTYLPPNCTLDQVIAFDTGPGNMVIDAVVQSITARREQFDREGARAARGGIEPALLDALHAHPFFQRRPPKSTGREEFGAEFVVAFLERAQQFPVAGDDLVTTATMLTVETIADAYRKFLPSMNGEVEVIIGGGGAHNTTMMRLLAARIAPWTLLRHEDVGLNSDAKEAMAFALLAHLTACGLPGNVPQATGAKRAVVLGKLCYP